jgi:hypothetical protein
MRAVHIVIVATAAGIAEAAADVVEAAEAAAEAATADITVAAAVVAAIVTRTNRIFWKKPSRIREGFFLVLYNR